MKQITRLEAFKELLLAIGEMPGDDIDVSQPSTPEEVLADLYLNKVTLEVLNSTRFNKKTLTEIPTDFTDIIRIENKGWVLLNDTLVDTETKEEVTDLEDEKLEVVVYMDFEECPYPVQSYILTRTIRKLQDKIEPDNLVYKLSKEDELEALYEMTYFEDETVENNNMLPMMKNRRRYY